MLEHVDGGSEIGERIELIRGSGNVFFDFGRPSASLEQARAMFTAEIILTLDAACRRLKLID